MALEGALVYQMLTFKENENNLEFKFRDLTPVLLEKPVYHADLGESWEAYITKKIAIQHYKKEAI